MDYQKLLQQLGFNGNEIAVYMALLGLGMTQAGPIVKATKLHRMMVYTALDKLVQDGFATVVRKKNIQLFQPVDPGILVEKTQRLHELAKAAAPAFRNLLQKSENVVNVRTLVGFEGFIHNLEEIVLSAAKQKDRTVAVIGGAKDKDFYEAVDGWYKNYTDLLKKNKVHKKLLAPASYSAEFKKKFAAEPASELRLLPKGLSSPTYTRITKEMVSIEIYHPQLIVIQIRNPAIAEGYLDSFKLLWDTAE